MPSLARISCACLAAGALLSYCVTPTLVSFKKFFVAKNSGSLLGSTKRRPYSLMPSPVHVASIVGGQFPLGSLGMGFGWRGTRGCRCTEAHAVTERPLCAGSAPARRRAAEASCAGKRVSGRPRKKGSAACSVPRASSTGREQEWPWHGCRAVWRADGKH